MGYGNYSFEAHEALVAGRKNLGRTEVFTQRECHPLMSPKGLRVRESRDSADHPDSLGIVFALDVTGSMGDIPHQLATQELPEFMKLLGACRVPDPQVLFMAVGDATNDQAPLQLGQFETTAELMDQWLTWCYIEGGGGGGDQESYELAFYFAVQHTDLDCWEKRRKKGYLFLTGDELPYPAVSRHVVEALFGEKLDEDIPVEEVIAASGETYHPFFLIPDLHRRERCERRWRDLLGDRVICMESPEDTCRVAAGLVALTEGRVKDLDELAALLGKEGGGERVPAVIRALRPYAALLEGPATATAPPVEEKPRPTWWKRLFD